MYLLLICSTMSLSALPNFSYSDPVVELRFEYFHSYHKTTRHSLLGWGKIQDIFTKTLQDLLSLIYLLNTQQNHDRILCWEWVLEYFHFPLQTKRKSSGGRRFVIFLQQVNLIVGWDINCFKCHQQTLGRFYILYTIRNNQIIFTTKFLVHW